MSAKIHNIKELRNKRILHEAMNRAARKIAEAIMQKLELGASDEQARESRSKLRVKKGGRRCGR